MTNRRIYWAIQAVGIAPLGSDTYTEVHGVQSVGITTTFNLEQVFELGQLAIYENIEDIPDIEVTLEKVLDGYPLIYHLATRGYTAPGIAGRQNQECSVGLSIYGDTQNSASGVPISQVTMSGMFVSSLTYTFPVDGNCTESVTLVGNNKVWSTAGLTFTPNFTNTDEPLALTSGTGGVQRREDVIFEVPVADVTLDANNQVITTAATILPPDIDGISSSGTNNLVNDEYQAHLQSITVSTDLGRENLNELGRKGPYYRFVNFPVEVTCEIEMFSSRGDFVDATEAAASNLTDRSIRIYVREGTFLNLGTKNKLASVTYGGGDTGGGNATNTYSYSTFNDLIVVHPQDPVVA